jgi:hypothetical protein
MTLEYKYLGHAKGIVYLDDRGVPPPRITAE